jgi:hypothetical protein
MAQGQTHSLRYEEIVADLISDNFSDVPYIKSDGASDIEGKIKNMPHGSVCDSDSEISSDESISYAGATNWGVNDKMTNLGHFTGNSRVKEIPSDPSNVSKVT